MSDTGHLHYCRGAARHAWAEQGDAEKCCAGFARVRQLEPDGTGQFATVRKWVPIDDLPTGVPHEAFVRALSESAETAPEWPLLVAGFVAMRLAVGRRPPCAQEVEAVRRRVATVAEPVVRRALSGIVGAVLEEREVGPVLVTFARALMEATRYRLADEVLMLVLDRARCGREHAIMPMAYEGRGYCAVQLGRPDAAMNFYRAGRILAAGLNDTEAEFRLRIAEANIFTDRGEASEAERLLSAIATEATAAGRPDTASRAWHDCGVAVYRQDREADALLLYDRALAECSSANRQARILHDVALALLDLGDREHARLALEVTCAMAEGANLAQRAALNLVRVAIADRDESAYERWTGVVDGMELSPALRVDEALNHADGHLAFGRVAAAKLAYTAAITAANECNAVERAERAKRALRSLRAKHPPEPALPSRRAPAQVDPVLARLRELHAVHAA